MIHQGERYINPLTEHLDDYEMSINAYREIKNGMDSAERAGIRKGRAEGRKEGRAEGRKEGRAQGRAEERTEMARKMKSEGFDVETISRITNLTTDDIQNL